MPRSFLRLLATTRPHAACLSLLMVMLVAGTAAAADRNGEDANTLRAAAVVNDIVISTYDLDQRVKLMMVTSGAQGADAAKRLRPQILRLLIDELLQLQEAQKSKVQVTPEDIEKSLKRISQQNNIPVEQIYKTLDDNGIARSTLLTQIRADIAWQRLVQGRLAPRVTVSEEEVDAAFIQAQEASKQTQYQIAEIFLAVDVPGAEEQVKQNMQNIIGQLRQGANFSALARQVSQSATASSGGDLGWVTLSDLPPPVADKVKALATGTISDPVRAAGGYYLVALRQKRLAAGSAPEAPRQQPAVAQPEQKMKSVLTLARVSIPAGGSKAKEQEAAQIAGDLIRNINGCSSASNLSRARGAKFALMGQISVKDMPPGLVDVLRKTPNGRSTPPLRGPKGYELFVICEGGMRPAVNPGVPDDGDRPATEVSKEEIENRLFNQELSMLARRYLRDLRRDATIEIKEN